MTWALFCRVIDNFGDIGICWRLACDLASRGQRVRLWVDDPSALEWMAPQGRAGVEVRAWTEPLDLHRIEAGDVLVEAFGCRVPDEFVALFSVAKKDGCSRASGPFHAWINLEYLSAESFARRAHGLPSPVLRGPGAGLAKHFFYPGFTEDSGGLIRETDLPARQQRFDRRAWLARHQISFSGERLIALFCYEPPALARLVEMLASDTRPTRLLVTAGRPTRAIHALLGGDAARGALSVSYLPRLTQHDFDHLLWACDLNFVRGEDSLVRALWAGKPLVWQAYPQEDGAHAAKLRAWLGWFDAPPSLVRFHRVWNGLDRSALPPFDLPAWSQAAVSARDRLLAQDDLGTRLLRFVGPETVKSKAWHKFAAPLSHPTFQGQPR